MSRVSQSNTSLPTPPPERPSSSSRAGVASGPVQPPKAYSTWWVYVPMLVFLALAAFAVFGVKWKKVEEAEVMETLSDGVIESLEEDVQKIYSYLSVVTAVLQTNAYSGTEDECEMFEPLEMPTHIEEPLYFLVRTQANEAFSGLARFVALMNAHDLPVTIEVASDAVPQLAAWALQGNEVALYVDVSRLFENPVTPLAYGTWLSALHDLRDEVEVACGCDVTSWSGGEWYERIFDVTAQLGFSTTMDWQDELGRVPEALAVTNPWTPAKSDSVEGLTEFDPSGSIVYLPAGFYPTFCAGTLVQNPPTEETLSFVTRALYNSLDVSLDTKINVFQVEFALDSTIDEEIAFEQLETWLTQVIDPLVASRKLIPSTAAKTAQAYRTWLGQVSGTILPVYLEKE